MIEMQDWSFKIGKFFLSPYSDTSLWLSYPDGEGQEISEEKFEAMLKKLYDENF